MGGWRRAFAQPAFPVLLFIVALALFCWPFLTMPSPSLEEGWRLLIVAWGAVILLLFLMSRSLGCSPPGRPPDGPPHV